MSGGELQKQTPSPLRGDQGGVLPDREARRPRRGRAFCPPDKGGSRGVFFPIGKQWDSPTKNKPPPPFQDVLARRGTTAKPPPPFEGIPLIRRTTAKPPPPFGGIPLIRGTTATNLPDKGVSIPDREARRPRRGRAFCPPDKGGSRGVFFPIGKWGGSPQSKPPPPFGGIPLIRGTTAKTPSPLRGYPPYQGDNSNTP